MGKYKVGVLGGCALEQSNLIQNKTEKEVTTVHGNPTGILVEGTVEGIPVAYILWHGKPSTAPGKVNFKGNVWALKEAGCTHVISVGTCTSLKEEIKPGDFIIIDSFLDFTLRDDQTFRDGGTGTNPELMRLPMSPAVCEPLAQLCGAAADELGYSNQKAVNIITVQGPRFSSKIESKVYQSWGLDALNYNTVPEVVLAKEAGMLYASFQLVACYDSWKEGVPVITRRVLHTEIDKNVDKIEELTKLIIKKIDSRDWDAEINELNKLLGGDGGRLCGCPSKR